MTVEYTREELLNLVDRNAQETVSDWLDAGKGVAVYQNQDLGHPELGHRKFVSFGTPESWFGGTEWENEPRNILPDTPTELNYRYCLEGTCREL